MNLKLIVLLWTVNDVANGAFELRESIRTRRRRQGEWVNSGNRGQQGSPDYESLGKAAEEYLNRHAKQGYGFPTTPSSRRIYGGVEGYRNPAYGTTTSVYDLFNRRRGGSGSSSRNDQPAVIPVKKKEQFWCYACASPKSTVHHDLVTAMEQLYQIRGTKYPSGRKLIIPDCDRPRRLSDMVKEECPYSPYCYTGYFHDTVSGRPLTVRGCAHKYHAINSEVIGDKGACRRPHPSLEIEECICKNQHYCVDPENGVGRPRTFVGKLWVTVFSVSLLTLLRWR